MAGTGVAGWLQTLQNEPWFAQDKVIFNDDGVSDAIWESTLFDEDATLNPTQATPESDGGTSYGLFQFKQGGTSGGLGNGYTIGTLEDPIASASIAAQIMGDAITSKGDQNAAPSKQLQDVELAGWNGSLSEDATRQANLAALEAAGVNTTPQGALGAQSSESAVQQAANSAASGVIGALGLPNASTISDWITKATIGALLLGLIAGGFALLAAPAAVKAAPLAAAAA